MKGFIMPEKWRNAFVYWPIIVALSGAGLWTIQKVWHVAVSQTKIERDIKENDQDITANEAAIQTVMDRVNIIVSDLANRYTASLHAGNCRGNKI
jgi:hypothetical protein